MGPTRLTFVICSHRAPAGLEATLRSILAQREPGDAEIILVNNGFDAAREATIEALLASGAAGGVRRRIVREPRPGLGFARRTGFLAAEGEYLVLLDDDNTIESDFTIELRSLIDRAGPLACISPAVEPRWEGEAPAAWLREFGRLCLSYNTVDGRGPAFEERVWPAIDASRAIRPPGGGMILHRRAAQHYLSQADERRLALGRGPASLHGCEDQDLFDHAIEVGLPVAYCARLRCRHHIATSKLTPEYLRRLNYEMGESYGMLARMAPAGRGTWRLAKSIARAAAAPLRSRGRARLLGLLFAREAGFVSGYARGPR